MCAADRSAVGARPVTSPDTADSRPDLAAVLVAAARVIRARRRAFGTVEVDEDGEPLDRHEAFDWGL